MNKQLELFLNHCKLSFVRNGKLYYHIRLDEYFTDCPRYATGTGVERDEDSEITLCITVDKTGAIACHLWVDIHDDPLDSVEFSMVNATIPKIEEWLLSANTNVDNAPVPSDQVIA